MASARKSLEPKRRNPGGSRALEIQPDGLAGASLEAVLAFVRNMPLAAAITDKEIRFLAASPAWLNVLGLTAEQLIGRSSYEVFPTTREKFGELHQRCLGGETMSGPPELMERPDGEVRWVAAECSPWFDHRGEIGGIMLIAHDHTARMQAEEEVRRGRAFLTTILENTPQAMMVKDDQGRFLMMNRAAEQVFGFERSKVLGQTVAEASGLQEVAEGIAAEDRQAFASPDPVSFEESPIVTMHRGERLLRKTKVVIRDEGAPDYLLVVGEDVTDRRREQDELERTRAFLSTVIDHVPVGLLIKNIADGRIVMMNPANEEMLGVTRDEIVGKTVWELFTAADAEQRQREDKEILESGRIWVFEEELDTPHKGRRAVHKMKVGIRTPDGSAYVMTIADDITERKKAQDALKNALARAEAANVAKSEFLANMSHEIRTPLNGVLGLADALARMELTPKQLEIVSLIVTSGKALTAILSDVLDLAKAEAGQLELHEESLSLRETIGAAAFLFETVAHDKGVDFRVTFDPGPDRLVGDSLRIKQVASNLISNAVKFTSLGEVSIHVASSIGEDRAVALEVTVRDTGPGFTEEARAKLFARFEQGDGSITRQYGGTGLGLAIAGRLAKMMGGGIDCTGAPGEGATFVFRAQLTLDEAAPGIVETAGDDRTSQAAPRLRVLLAEDHVVNQRVVQLMLDGAAELLIVSNGQEAVDAFLNHPPFDVVLMDTQMPVMDGLTATRSIREAEASMRRARVPIISLTANAMAHQVQAAKDAGADLHLAKPITSDNLYSSINQAMESAAGLAESDNQAAKAG